MTLCRKCLFSNVGSRGDIDSHVQQLAVDISRLTNDREITSRPAGLSDYAMTLFSSDDRLDNTIKLVITTNRGVRIGVAGDSTIAAKLYCMNTYAGFERTFLEEFFYHESGALTVQNSSENSDDGDMDSDTYFKSMIDLDTAEIADGLKSRVETIVDMNFDDIKPVFFCILRDNTITDVVYSPHRMISTYLKDIYENCGPIYSIEWEKLAIPNHNLLHIRAMDPKNGMLWKSVDDMTDDEKEMFVRRFPSESDMNSFKENIEDEEEMRRRQMPLGFDTIFDVHRDVFASPEAMSRRPLVLETIARDWNAIQDIFTRDLGDDWESLANTE